LKFSIVCLLPYFEIIRARFLFIRSNISLELSVIKLINTFLRLEVSSSSYMTANASCRLDAAQ
jgi:hypothetical protein